jgi:hypothetical protein
LFNVRSTIKLTWAYADDGFANAGRGGSSTGVGQRAYETVGGAAKVAYGTVTGDEDTKKAGQEALYGERP